MVRICSFEANISCGKSTLIGRIMEKMKDNETFLLVDEPVDEWKKIIDSKGKNILDSFYSDMKGVALPFQIIALLTRRTKMLEKLKEAEEIEKRLNLNNSECEKRREVVIITERTVHSDYHIFAKMLFSQGFINEHGMLAYKIWNDIFSKESIVDRILYINTPPDVCYSRVKIRDREGEDKISLEYLIDCQKAHDRFYEEHISKQDHMIIDTSDIIKGTSEYEKLVDRVIEYFSGDSI